MEQGGQRGSGKVEAFIESCAEPVSYRQIKEAIGDNPYLTSAVRSDKITIIPGLFDRFISSSKDAPESNWMPIESERYHRKCYRGAIQAAMQ